MKGISGIQLWPNFSQNNIAGIKKVRRRPTNIWVYRSGEFGVHCINIVVYTGKEGLGLISKLGDMMLN